MCNRAPSSGEIYIFIKRARAERGREERWEYRGRGGGGVLNFIAKFGRFVAIIGVSEGPEKNIS
jgi:hypothetical protein